MDLTSGQLVEVHCCRIWIGQPRALRLVVELAGVPGPQANMTLHDISLRVPHGTLVEVRSISANPRDVDNLTQRTKI